MEDVKKSTRKDENKANGNRNGKKLGLFVIGL